ncbi:MAG TPA: glutathione S-transferase N-terminal domain-containing protein [Solirubrobacteraceae bacterium]
MNVSLSRHRLITIPISHYCEKARWALALGGIEYREERHVQGPSRIASKRAGGGGTTPVLVTPTGALSQSEDIVAYADPSLRQREPAVAEITRWLDGDLGIAGRRLMYALVLQRPKVFLPFNNVGVPTWEARALKLAWPVFGPWAAHVMRIGPRTLEHDVAAVRRTFDTVAGWLADGRPYLFGEQFTAADLTFAALASPAVAPPEYSVPLPQPSATPTPAGKLILGYRAHPAGAFALRMFREKRWPPGQRPPARSAPGTASS